MTSAAPGTSNQVPSAQGHDHIYFLFPPPSGFTVGAHDVLHEDVPEIRPYIVRTFKKNNLIFYLEYFSYTMFRIKKQFTGDQIKKVNAVI